ncbi:MAG: endonuclease domain-containing protein [Oscillospiraceae bacterium]|nr:endonuclease domain-containing protein [Oscillospiraceae bacterium]
MIKYNGLLTPRAKEMRKNMTPQEQHLWFGYLRQYPVRVRRQQVIDQYIADFYCQRAKLVIEVDGVQHNEKDAQDYDRIRSLILNEHGLQILRFANQEVDHNFFAVCKAIDSTIKSRLDK